MVEPSSQSRWCPEDVSSVCCWHVRASCSVVQCSSWLFCRLRLEGMRVWHSTSDLVFVMSFTDVSWPIAAALRLQVICFDVRFCLWLSQASGAVAARCVHPFCEGYRGVDDASNLLNPSEDKFRLDSFSTRMSIPEQSLFQHPTFCRESGFVSHVVLHVCESPKH